MKHGPQQRFTPGEIVPSSGIYRVVHYRRRLMHATSLLAGSRFPACRHCKSCIYFELVRVLQDSQIIAATAHSYLEEWLDDSAA